MSVGDLLLEGEEQVTWRSQKYNENINLMEAVLSFDMSFAIAAGRKLVFRNKKGFIDMITIYQKGKQILKLDYLQDQMELLCDVQSEANTRHHGSLFFGRNRSHDVLSY